METTTARATVEFGKLRFVLGSVNNRPVAKFFRGKKLVWYYRFESEARRAERIEEEKEQEEKRQAEIKADRAASAKARQEFKAKLKPGTILYSSFGYNMTLVSFYQVIEQKGAFVWVRKMEQNRETLDGGWSGKAFAKKGFLLGDPIKLGISNGYLRNGRSENLYLWDGRGLHFNSLD